MLAYLTVATAVLVYLPVVVAATALLYLPEVAGIYLVVAAVVDRLHCTADMPD